MKVLKKIIIILLSLIVIFLLSFKLNFANDKAFDIISTFLSITTGFSITALSIIATSPFSKKLYEVESKKNNSKTLLHILIDKFIVSTLIFIFCIGSIILYNYFPVGEKGMYFDFLTFNFNTIKLLKSSIWFFTIVSFIKFIDLFLTFSKFVIKSSTT